MIVSPHGSPAHPSEVLRTMAVRAVTDEEAQQLVALADALEQQFGKQNSAFQVALGLTDLDLRDAFAEEIVRVQVELSRRIDALDERQGEIARFLEELQAQVRGGTSS